MGDTRLDADRRSTPTTTTRARSRRSSAYDVLLVNPVQDGLNLVAKEGPLLNETDGVLALSREAGAWDEMAEGALEINPFDIADTSDVLADALAMSAADRAVRAATLRKAAGARNSRDWLDDQVAAWRS